MARPRAGGADDAGEPNAGEPNAPARRRVSSSSDIARRAASARRANEQRLRDVEQLERLRDIRRVPEREIPPPVGRLTRYSVTGLLGARDFSFDLEEGQPTILTGANGTGKSTILRSINAVGTAAWLELLDLPFDSLALQFEDEQPLSIEKTDAGLRFRLGRRKPFEMRVVDDARLRAWQGYAEDDPTLASRSREMSAAERRNYVTWRRMREDRWEEIRHDVPTWLGDLPQRFPVRFITEQRLIVHQVEQRPQGERFVSPQGDLFRAREATEERIGEAVSQYAAALGRLMTLQLNHYAAASQREDRAFPRRVVEAMTRASAVELPEVAQLLEQVAERRHALEQVGLAERVAGPEFDESSLSNSQVRPVIKTHAEATLRKFSVLDDLRYKLDLFTSFLNDHFVGKRALTQADDGLVFLLENGSPLKPSRLSSGEQQMLVLAYQLLFETPEGTTLLIDEPEISLHVGWQRSFVEDITAMGQPHRINFLLATHSPTLIGGREELKRSLDRAGQ